MTPRPTISPLSLWPAVCQQAVSCRVLARCFDTRGFCLFVEHSVALLLLRDYLCSTVKPVSRFIAMASNNTQLPSGPGIPTVPLPPPETLETKNVVKNRELLYRLMVR